MKNTFFFCFFISLTVIGYAHDRYQGFVKSKNGRGISNVQIADINSNAYAATDSNGFFQFEYHGNILPELVFSHPEYAADTVTTPANRQFEVTMEKIKVMNGVSIATDGSARLGIAGFTMKTEVIGQGEIKKAACCDLAGCFETQGTVQPMTTNILTNSKELRILGLSGVYNQVLIEGMPMVLGLGYTYGISSIPGTLVENIFVSKGTTSVLQGFESMVGQINVIPKNTNKGERLFLNAYVNSFGESQYNMNYRASKGKWSNLASLHMVLPAAKWDRDKDNFLDLPLMNRYLFFDKIKYGDDNKDKFNFLLTLKGFKEQRVGGQSNFNHKTDLGNDSIYGQRVSFIQFESYSKASYQLNENRKVAWMGSVVYQDQNSWFGPVNYKAKQKQGYTNVQYEQTWNRSHEFKTGLSLRSLEINENISFSDTLVKRTYNGNYLKQELIPGAFAENTFKWRGDIITLITGIRADHHNQFGWAITPRTMLKYDITEQSTFRASAGTGWRTVNLFSENIGLMVSSRDIVFKEKLNPEKAFNWGVNYLQKFKKKKMEGYFTMDFYQTRFSNQFFPDYDSEPNKVLIYNFTGPSVSNGFQTDVNMKIIKRWELKLAYNYLDVYRKSNGVKTLLPFNSKHKGLIALSYLPINKKWRFDANVHWFGVQRLPDTELYPEAYRQAKTSQPYTTYNLQITRSWLKLDVYAGCENITDYRQLRPIVSWQNPFSPYFDTSFNWGPTRGREIYLGLRFKVN